MCALAGCAARWDGAGLTIKEGVLSVGVEVGYPPMEYFDADGALAGFDIELAKALAGKLNLRVEFIDTAWEGILAGLDARQYDVALNISVLPERQKRHLFTKPYIYGAITIAALKRSSIKIEKPGDIAGRRVSYQSDTTAQYFTERLKTEGVVFSPFAYDKILNCFDDLALGRVDIVVADNLAVFGYAGKEDSPFEAVWQGPPDEPISLCLKKGNGALAAALDRALDELFAEGAMAEISRKTFGRDLVSSIRPCDRQRTGR